MNVTNFAASDLGRRLYEEIALVEEEHVTQYEDLMDSSSTWLEMLLWHEYNECYLYWSNYMTETDRYIKRLWEENFAWKFLICTRRRNFSENTRGRNGRK